MFIAKFSQVSEESKFEADKNGNLPYIGEILAGKAKGSIINGTIFEREGLLPNKMYACETKEVEDTETGEVYTNVVILDQVSILEYQALSKELGKGMLIRENKVVEETVEETVEDDLPV